MTTDALSGLEHTPVAQPTVAATAITPKRVMIIDDELVGLSYSHLPNTITQFFDDRTSPEFSELWSLVMHIKGFGDLLTEDSAKVRAYASSDAMVQEIILSAHFKATATEQLKQPLATFLERAQGVQKLREHLESAFPAPEYEVTFQSARPTRHADLMQYNLLVFDLVLKKSAGAVDEIVNYLLALGNTAYPAPLPCIIVMSNRQELLEERVRFSNESNISAAGLLLLPKAEVVRENFGASGLALSYHLLDRQRDVAQKMRVFMKAWMDALEDARKKASIALWNLDAAAMQEIHLEAFNDNDPYDEHLNELIAREYLWHVESVPAVGKAIETLDGCFQAQFKAGTNPAMIGQRFMAPFVKPKYGRELISHYTWTGFNVPSVLSDVTSEDAIKRFNKLVPFGAVLAQNKLTPTSECLIHITQQCDLNGASRVGKDGKYTKMDQSALFAMVKPVEVQDFRIPPHSTDDLVARGLHIDGKEYDFILIKGRQISLSIPKFIDYAHTEGLRVVGRLRHDIATHFLLATANHMTRPASQKVSLAEIKEAQLYLYGEKFLGQLLPLLDPETNKPMAVKVATSNKLTYFQDDTSMRVALWIAQQLSNNYGITDIDVAFVCNKLSVGLRNNECLVKLVDFKTDIIKQNEIVKQLNPEKAPKDKVNFMLVYEPEAG